MIEIFRYWRKNVPIPEGWELADSFDGCHHGHHAILIRKVEGK